MRGGVGVVVVVCSLAIVALLMAMNMSQNGPTSKTAQDAEARAKAAVGTINFTQAAMELATFQAENGTYVGATLPASYGVTLVRSDAASYCLQAGVGGSVQHFVGPGGPAGAGPC